MFSRNRASTRGPSMGAEAEHSSRRRIRRLPALQSLARTRAGCRALASPQQWPTLKLLSLWVIVHYLSYSAAGIRSPIEPLLPTMLILCQRTSTGTGHTADVFTCVHKAT